MLSKQVLVVLAGALLCSLQGWEVHGNNAMDAARYSVRAYTRVAGRSNARVKVYCADHDAAECALYKRTAENIPELAGHTGRKYIPSVVKWGQSPSGVAYTIWLPCQNDIATYAQDMPLREKRDTLLRLMLQVMQGMDYIHKLGWVHGNIGPHAICVYKDASGEASAMLHDFRYATRFKRTRDTASAATASQPRYYLLDPPKTPGSEMALPHMYDIWNVGTTFYGLLLVTTPSTRDDAANAKLVAWLRHLRVPSLDQAITYLEKRYRVSVNEKGSLRLTRKGSQSSAGNAEAAYTMNAVVPYMISKKAANKEPYLDVVLSMLSVQPLDELAREDGMMRPIVNDLFHTGMITSVPASEYDLAPGRKHPHVYTLVCQLLSFTAETSASDAENKKWKQLTDRICK